MAQFYIEETIGPDGAEVVLHRVEPLAPDQAQRLIARGMLKPDDEPVGRTQIGAFTVDYPDGAFPKKVRRAALAWLAEHAGMTEADSVEIQLATREGLELLARIEAAVSA